MAEESAFKRRRTASDGNPSCPHPHNGAASIEPIDVDMGGVLFRVSKTTLVDNSSYFESLLSHRWRSDSDGDGGSGALFVDQDPKAFEVLLNYMRSGMVYLPRDDPYLCKKALMLAEYLGVHGFLIAVKAITMKNVSRRRCLLSSTARRGAGSTRLCRRRCVASGPTLGLASLTGRPQSRTTAVKCAVGQQYF